MITAALDGFDELVEQLHSTGRDVHGTPEERTRNEAYEYALDSTDELFLMNLYDWYLETGKSDRLLEVRPKPSHWTWLILPSAGQQSTGRELPPTSRHQGG